LNPADHYRTLGVSPGSSEKQIKAAYRKMALKYHPDLNHAPDAEQKFREINTAYEYLLKHQGMAADAGAAYSDTMAREVFRRERERMQQQARARWEKKRREQEFFDSPEWHDPLLLLKYMLHGFTLVFATAAIAGPILIAILVDPASLAGTLIFLVVGVFLVVYMYQHRGRWFRLGKFHTTWKDLAGFFRMQPEGLSKDRCCYRRNTMAGGKPYHIELLKTLHVRTRSYGALNHVAGYENKVKRVVIPRSARAHYFHKVSSFTKIVSITGFMIFFPVDSLLWRFFAGMVAGGLLSACILGIAGVRSKVSYLFTPGLILKTMIWLFALYMISVVGPGFNIRTTGYVYLVVAGLFFLLDMAFDLVMGFFPFYRWFFRPLIRQGKIMDGLYREGFQNYQELPVYSVFFPFFRWLF
jgi:hypothetical protein